MIQSHAPKLVILGPQGAGKGTQGQRLSKHLDLDHISTGDLLRSAVADQTVIGKEAKAHMDAGELVPDDIMVRLVAQRLEEPATVRRGFLLDGYPRNITQARALEALRGDDGLDAVIVLRLPIEFVYRRLASRRVCPNCQTVLTAVGGEAEMRCPVCSGTAIARSDDTPEAIARRLELYERETEPLIDHYAERGLLVEVDGRGSPETVFEHILRGLRPMIWGTSEAVG